MAGTSLKNLQVFQRVCGRDALGKVYLTTTMWDEVDLNVGERRLDELKEDYWKSIINQGAQIVRCRSDDDSPKRIIQQILAEEAAGKVPPEVSEEPPAIVSTENLETDDIVIAYVIQPSTVKHLT